MPSVSSVRRVVLLDDHAIVRRGLRQLFEREADFTVCAEAETAAEGLHAVETEAPDLLVADLTLEGRSGFEVLHQIRQHPLPLSVLVVSMHDDLMFVDRALAAGADGYVTKRHAERDVIRASRAVLSGQTFVLGRVGPPLPSAEDPVAQLSDREFEVFLLLGRGYAPRHAAERLSLSVSTVEAHRERMKVKLGVQDSPTLVRYAVNWCHHRMP